MVENSKSYSANRPPPGLPGLKSEWSHLLESPDADGVLRTWHFLDNNPSESKLTILCVHGNPSWSYLWRDLFTHCPTDVRIIAVDQLDMGFSDRTKSKRTLEMRIQDLHNFTQQLDVSGPIITIAHDWGGPISLGWAQLNYPSIKGIILLNTAVHQPERVLAPILIKFVRLPGVLQFCTQITKIFIRGALQLTQKKLSSSITQAFFAPYKSSKRRKGIKRFVQDIPLDDNHKSFGALELICDRLGTFKDTPALLIWGARDRVFSDRYLDDLEKRIPHANVHRFAEAGHFVSEEIDLPKMVFTWLKQLGIPEQTKLSTDEVSSLTTKVADPSLAIEPAIVEATKKQASINFGELNKLIEQTCSGLLSLKVIPGSKVALMIYPGINLSALLYACWKIGAIPVLIDAGLGRSGMSKAIRSAKPDYLVGDRRAIFAARLLRWPGTRISVKKLSKVEQILLRCKSSLPSFLSLTPTQLPRLPKRDDQAAIVFTSGATGPSKGVRYTHRQLESQRDALMELYEITSADRLVAAFAPFALYGPAMGIPSIVPNMDVSAPGTLTAAHLIKAVQAIDASLVFASPAAIANVISTSSELCENELETLGNVRLVLCAGAPVRPQLMKDFLSLTPNAKGYSPYGMTEVLPATNVGVSEMKASIKGVNVGKPAPGVEIAISPLDQKGISVEKPTSEINIVGEVKIRSSHTFDGYNQLWHTDALSRSSDNWHASGDIGSLDQNGDLWIGGRLIHVISTPKGLVMPVSVEFEIEEIPEIYLAAAVGVGPPGLQHIVAVVEVLNSSKIIQAAPMPLVTKIRSITSSNIAAVLTVKRLPVDRRHNSKIDRVLVKLWADRALSGEKVKTK